MNESKRTRASDHRDRRRAKSRPSLPGAPAPNRERRHADLRANAKRNYERYVELARAAVLAGDAVEGENLFQHAEHYFRTMREQEPSHGDDRIA